MKTTKTLLNTIIISITLIMMGCSQSEDLLDAGTQELSRATNNNGYTAGFNSNIFTPSSDISPYNRNVRIISYVY